MSQLLRASKTLLPNGWCIGLVEDVTAKISNGFTCKQSKIADGIPVTRIETISNGVVDLSRVGYVTNATLEDRRKWKLELGDILFSHINSDLHLGKTALFSMPNVELLHAMNLLSLKPKLELISAKFLNYWLNWLRVTGHFQSIAQHAVNQSSINISKLKQVEVPIPPQTEQTRIVAKLEELLSDLDAGVAELKSAQKKLTQYRQSLLKAAVEGALTKEWREQRKKNTDSLQYASSRPSRGEGKEMETAAQLLQRILKERRARWEAKQLAKFKEQGKAPPKDWQDKYPEPVKPDTTNLPELPESWVWATIDQLGHIGTGVTPLRSNSSYFNNGTIPWVTSGALNYEHVTDASEFVTKLALEKCRLDIYPPGSLLVAMYGEGKTRGKCAELMISATINQAIAAIVLEPQAECCKDYLKTFLLNSYEKMRSQASGGVQPNLNLQIVKNIALPLPPVSEQQQIAILLHKQFELINDQSAATELAMKQSTAQRKNILKAAFSGQLVPQDPNDEPARALLERIRAERATRDGAKMVKERKVGGRSRKRSGTR